MLWRKIKILWMNKWLCAGAMAIGEKIFLFKKYQTGIAISLNENRLS